MHAESQSVERKSLSTVTRKPRDWAGLAEECVAFANARGGEVHLGIEDGMRNPPSDQKIPDPLARKVHAKIDKNTTNVEFISDIIKAKNGGEFICLKVLRSERVASTSDGGYHLRIAGENRPLVGDDIIRLATDRANWSWETQITARIPRSAVDSSKLKNLVSRLKGSKNAKDSVKRKTVDQMLDHFKLAEGKHLTNLGILCVGRRQDRAKLGVAPIIHFIKKDGSENKTNKIVWDDHYLNPMELVDDVWKQIPDFRETYEVPNGLYRDLIPAFDEEIVRELLVNALVHRPYTQKGDIYLYLFPDRLELVNPGLLPIGVTPRNILHESVRRNEHLARLLHDVGLMEREGTGMDRIYDILLSQGRPMPELKEDHDSVTVTVHRRYPDREVIKFITDADKVLDLSCNERIVLGLLAKKDSASARTMSEDLGFKSVKELKGWMKRLLDKGIVTRAGNTQATQYSVDPAALNFMESLEDSTTPSKNGQDDYMELVESDISQNPLASIGEIHDRIGDGITRRQLRTVLSSLVKSGRIVSEGVKRGTRYMTQ